MSLDVPAEIFTWLLRQPGGSCKIKTLLKDFPSITSEDSLVAEILEYPNLFLLWDKVKPAESTLRAYHPNAQLCFRYYKTGQCDDNNCSFLHICPSKLFYNHCRCLNTNNCLANDRINNKATVIQGFKEDEVQISLRNSCLAVCLGYNTVDGCMNMDQYGICPYVHVCVEEVQGTCAAKKECPWNHSILNEAHHQDLYASRQIALSENAEKSLMSHLLIAPVTGLLLMYLVQKGKEGATGEELELYLGINRKEVGIFVQAVKRQAYVHGKRVILRMSAFQICPFYNTGTKCLCYGRAFHVCAKYIMSKCRKCSLSHDLHKELIDQLFTRSKCSHLSTEMRRQALRNSALMICDKYTSDGICSNKACCAMHVCNRWVTNSCTLLCNKDHSFKTEHNREVIKIHDLNPWNENVLKMKLAAVSNDETKKDIQKLLRPGDHTTPCGANDALSLNDNAEEHLQRVTKLDDTSVDQVVKRTDNQESSKHLRKTKEVAFSTGQPGPFAIKKNNLTIERSMDNCFVQSKTLELDVSDERLVKLRDCSERNMMEHNLKTKAAEECVNETTEDKLCSLIELNIKETVTETPNVNTENVAQELCADDSQLNEIVAQELSVDTSQLTENIAQELCAANSHLDENVAQELSAANIQLDENIAQELGAANIQLNENFTKELSADTSQLIENMAQELCAANIQLNENVTQELSADTSQLIEDITQEICVANSQIELENSSTIDVNEHQKTENEQQMEGEKIDAEKAIPALAETKYVIVTEDQCEGDSVLIPGANDKNENVPPEGGGNVHSMSAHNLEETSQQKDSGTLNAELSVDCIDLQPNDHEIHELSQQNIDAVQNAEALLLPLNVAQVVDYCWKWLSDDGIWHSYGIEEDSIQQDLIEARYQEFLRQESAGIIRFETHTYMYELVLSTMQQINLMTNKIRPVMRYPIPLGYEGLRMMSFIPQDLPVVIPPWSPMDTRNPLQAEMVALGFSQHEFKEVANHFFTTFGNSTSISVSRVYRIQNMHLWRRYNKMREEMSEKLGTDLNERNLFHGTPDFDTVQCICNQNFDSRISGRHGTKWGDGAYFAASSAFSHHYTRPSLPRGMHYMFLATVLVGRCAQGARGLKRPPPYGVKKHGVLCDSVADNPKDPRTFVIFNNDQAYPMYLIEYHDNRTAIPHAPVLMNPPPAYALNPLIRQFCPGIFPPPQ